MIDLKWVRENPEKFDETLAKRGMEPMSEKILALDEEKRKLIGLVQQLQQTRNLKSKEFGQISDKNSNAYELIKKEAEEIKENLSKAEEKLHSNSELEDLLVRMPNLLDAEVPFGESEEGNVEVRKWGKEIKFDFPAKQHFEIGEELAMMDFEQTAKISGSRFVSLSQDLAKLERALANFMLDVHVKEFGYDEFSVPFLVRDEAMFGAGQLPKFAEDSFETTNAYRLIPTSEVSLVNLGRDRIFNKQDLPIRMVAYSPCFRSEAGSAGRDTRGMIRLHQFSKVELVSLTTQEQEEEELQRKTKAAETILQKLELPYRVMILCSGDIGFHSQKTYDLEVWMAGQGKYREISSCSKCGDFQTRRIKARYRDESDTTRQVFFAKSLNGSGVAVGRTIAAILENFQNEDGSVNVPEILQPYLSGLKKIEKKRDKFLF